MTEILTNSELNIPFYFLIQGSVREAARSRPTSHAGLVLKNKHERAGNMETAKYYAVK